MKVRLIGEWDEKEVKEMEWKDLLEYGEGGGGGGGGGGGFFFASRRRHTRLQGDWSSDVCSSDLLPRIFLLYMVPVRISFLGHL